MDENEDQQIFLEQLMDNYKNPQNKGKIENYTFFAHQKNSNCGDSFNLYVKLNENEDKIIDVKYEGEGCAISTASLSLLSQKLKYISYKEAKKLTDKDIYDLIGIKISPGRINCAMLSINCLKKGISNFENNGKK